MEYRWADAAGVNDGVGDRASAFDTNGNVYTTGGFTGTLTLGDFTLTSAGDRDAFIAKARPDGTYVWAVSIGGTSTDEGRAIYVEGTQVFVAGYFAGTVDFNPNQSVTNSFTASGTDTFLLELTTDGAYTGIDYTSGAGNEIPYSMTGDGAGNLYLVGSYTGTATFNAAGTVTSSGSSDGFILQANTNPAFTSVQSITGTSAITARSVAINGTELWAVGDFTGTANFNGATTPSLTSAGSSDAFIAEADIPLTGTFEWAMQAGGTGADLATSVASSSTGTTIVSGQIDNTNSDAAFGALGNATGSALDGFVSGFTENAGGTAGVFSWLQVVGSTGTDAAWAVSFDDQDYAYVAGAYSGTVTFSGVSTALTSAGGTDGFIAQLDLVSTPASPDFEWATSTGGTGDDFIYSAVTRFDTTSVPQHAYIQLSGHANGTTTLSDQVIAGTGTYAFNAQSYYVPVSLQYKWAKPIFSNANSGDTVIGYDSAGNAYLCGTFSGTITVDTITLTSQGETDGYVAKFDRDGNLQWAQRLGGASYDGLNAIVVGSDALYIAGYYYGQVTIGSTTLTSTGDSDLFVSKLDLSGNFSWTTGTGGLGYDTATSLALNPAGTKVIVGGQYVQNVSFGSTILASNSNSADLFVASLEESAGSFEWVYGTGGTGTDTVNDIAVDSQGRIYAVGQFRGSFTWGTKTVTSAGSADIYVLRLSSTGTYEWVETAGSTGSDSANSIVINSNDIPYVVGNYIDSITFEQTLDLNTTSSTEQDFFVLEIDPILGEDIDGDGVLDAGEDFNGNTTLDVAETSHFEWSAGFGGTGNDSANSIGVDAAGFLYITGQFQSTVTFTGSGQTLTSGGTTARDADVYLGQFDPAGKVFTNVLQSTGLELDFGSSLAVETDTDTGERNVYLTMVGYSEGVMNISSSLSLNGGTAYYYLAQARYALPTITSSLTADAAEGDTSFSYTLTASNAGRIPFRTTYSATGFPVDTDGTTGDADGVWMKFDTNTQVMSLDESPIPSANYPITYDITLKAVTEFGEGSGTLKLTVTDAEPAVTNTTFEYTAQAGNVYTAASPILTISATNTPTGFTDVNNVLATHNLQIDASGNLITIGGGTLTGGTYPTILSLVVTADNASGSSNQATFYIQVTAAAPSPVITSSLTAEATLNQHFEYTITADNMPTNPVSNSYIASNLPTGLSIDSISGTISGTPTVAGTYNVSITADNAPPVSGDATEDTETLVITVVDKTPVITSNLEAFGTSGNSFSYQITATNTPTSYAASFLPSWLSVDTSTGILSGTAVTGSYVVLIKATNASGTDSETLSITITTPKPEITSSLTATADEGDTSFSYTIGATNSPTAYSATGLPTWLQINTTTGAITDTGAGVPVGNYPISYPITITASNAAGTDTETLYLTVSDSAPVIESSLSDAARAGVFYSYSIVASGVASGTANPYDATGLPSGLTINKSTGVISGTPTQLGTYNITISATDAHGTDTKTLTLVINEGVPVITSSLTDTATEGQAYNYTLTAANMPNTPVASPNAYGATGLPAGLSIDATTGVISGTPTVSGTYDVTLIATNQYGSDWERLALTISSGLPSITSTLNAGGRPGAPFSYFITATNGPVSYSASGLPAGLTVNSGTGEISGTPQVQGSYVATISATNSLGTGSADLSIQLTDGSPVITSSLTATAKEQVPFSYNITASNSPTSFGATGLPSGLVLNSSTGKITGMPDIANYADGQYTVTITASNTYGSDAKTLTLTITDGEPTITSAKTATAYQGAYFSYTISHENDATSFTASGLPSGLTLDATTGLISGVPDESGSFTVTLTATNTMGTDNEILTLTVIDQRPVIISPLTASWNLQQPNFEYEIVATNLPTSYTAIGLPTGLSLNASTGLITGTPTSGGLHQVQIGATNQYGTTGATLSLTITESPQFDKHVFAGIGGSAASPSATAFNHTLTTTPAATSFVVDTNDVPGGLTFNTSTGVISGNATVFGTFSLSVLAKSNSGNNSDVITIILNDGTPVITSDLTLTATESDTAFNYTIAADNSPTAFSATNLPAFLQINAGTGAITLSGASIPTAVYPQTYTFDISATNATGTDTRTVTLVVADAAPTLTSPTSAWSLNVNSTFNLTTSFDSDADATNNADETFALSGDLPAGVSFTAATGQLSGTPTETGVFDVTITITDGANGKGSTTATHRLIVTDGLPAITSSTTVSVSEGAPLRYLTNATNSPTSYAITYVSGGDGAALPGWLSFNTMTGELSGTPAVDDYAAGSATWTNPLQVQLTATNANGAGPATVVAITVNDSKPVFELTSGFALNIVQGSSFSYAVPFTNSPDTFDLTNTVPALAAGDTLTLDTSTGILSGTLTSGTSYTLTIEASNIYGTGSTANSTITPVSGSSADGLVLNVEPGNPKVLSDASLPVAEGETVNKVIAATGSPTSYSANFLPMGLSFDAASGTISGSPLEYGTFTITVDIVNQYGTTTHSETIDVSADSATLALAKKTSVAWLENYGYTGDFAAAELEDPDGDGKPNWLEYLAATNPLDANSKFEVASLTGNGGTLNFDLTIPTAQSRTYTVEYSYDLANWQTLSTGINGTDGDVTVSDNADHTGQGQVYYRVIAEQR